MRARCTTEGDGAPLRAQRMKNNLSQEAGTTRVLAARHIAAVVAGNALEFYDFLAYAFFAVQIGRCFFPAQSPSSSLLLSLATFGAGFLTRPLGGVVIGMMADRRGRRPAMMLSFTLMGIGMLGLAVTPPFHAIGIAAPLIVLTLRLLQGFALGGEVGPTTAFLVEAAPASRRGLYGSLQFMTQNLAQFAAGLVGIVLAATVSARALDAWGWRIAFLIGASVVPLGLAIRRSLPETLNAGWLEPVAQHAGPGYRRIVVLGFLMLVSATIASYVQVDLTTYAQATLGLNPQVAFLATMVNGLSLACCNAVGGWLSDKFGRKPIMASATGLLAVCSYPAFFLMVRLGTPAALYIGSAVLGALLGIATGPLLTAITEALPARIRAGTVAVVYALAISVFGGSTQFVITWLIGATGNPLAPAWYMLGAAVVGLGAVLGLRESAPRAAPAPLAA